MSDEEAIRIQLARMEGKQDVANERLETANRINDERHTAIKVDIQNINTRLHTHGNRIGVLEADKHLNAGERKGIAFSGKVVWAIVGAVPIGALAVALRAFGA